jgi:enterochelin esterase family protein
MRSARVPSVFLALLVALMAAGAVHAAEEAPFRSVEILPDGRVTFHYRDPKAATVEVNAPGNSKPLPMTRDSAGVWSATTSPLAPETYWYSFVVDGRAQLDPQNMSVAKNLVYLASLVTVPGRTLLLWDPAPVPHGELHHHFYTTSITKGLPGNQTDFFVYTPPGYDARASRLYPVLFLLHGWSGTATDWVENLGANFILDNLIAQGKAKPMVVVMPLGYDSVPLAPDGLRLKRSELQGDPSVVSDLILNEVFPRVVAEYRISHDRKDRAVAGLSMGGSQSLFLGLAHPETFAWVGGFSSGVEGWKDYEGMFPGMDPKKADFRLFWISCGTADFLLPSNRRLSAWLTAKGFAVTEVETPGGHEGGVWRKNLIRFAQLVFQP